MGQLMSVDDHPFRVSKAEQVFLMALLLVAVAVIVALTLVTWLIRVIVGIADDPNAGPYRQVR